MTIWHKPGFYRSLKLRYIYVELLSFLQHKPTKMLIIQSQLDYDQDVLGWTHMT